MVENNIHSLTLVLAQRDPALLHRLANICARILNIDEKKIEVLAPGLAFELLLGETDISQLRVLIESELVSHGIAADFCLQKSADRRKELLICDMDSTLIGQECIDELADFAGVKDRVSAITERAMRGELEFEKALTHRVSLLNNLPLSDLQRCFDQRIHLNKGARTLAATMTHFGAETVIVSGGFTFFTSRIARQAGFRHNQANTLIDDGEKLTGEVGKPILGRDAKKAALIEFSARFGGTHAALAIGDGANDLSMIQAAGLGIAYRAKPIVANAAHCAINHTDLTSALYFQGYKESEFIRPSD